VLPADARSSSRDEKRPQLHRWKSGGP
jgi:hypothetical protein